MCENEENVLYGPETKVSLIDKHSFGNLLLESLKNHNDRICLIDASTREEVTFKCLLHKTLRAAASLRAMGITKNDVIAIVAENQLNFFIPAIAAFYLGVAVAPLNNSYTESELIHLLNISKPKVIFCASATVERILETQKNASFVKFIVTLEDNVKIGNVENIEEFLSRSPPVEDPYEYETIDLDIKEHVAAILCSSGTTGLPKGVMLTHLNFLTCISNYHDPRFPLFHPTKDNINLALMPFFHVAGLTTALTSIVWGSPLVVMKKFDKKLFLQTIQDCKIVSMMIVPSVMVFFVKSPLVENYNLSSIRQIVCGGAPLSLETETSVKKRLNLKDVRQAYGLTETTMVALLNPMDNIRSGSAGKIIPHLKGKICDLDTGKALGVRQTGELCFKGLIIMKGYYGNPEATRETIDEDGWFHTGDIGYYDEDGYFFIVDRIKELIKYKAFQVPPAELEHLLLANPRIKDAAVIGIPNEVAGELPKAYVVKQLGAEITAEEVQQYIADLVSPHKRLHGGVKFVEDIPKSPSGKILRRHLREQENITSEKMEKNIIEGTEPIENIYQHSLGRLLFDSLKKHGSRTVMIDCHTGKQVSFNWLLEKTIRAAESLKSIGIKKDDVISISSENNLNFYIPAIAALYLGVIVAPLNHAYTATEMMHTMNISKPKVIFSSAAIVDKFLEIRIETPYVKRVVTLESDEKIWNVESMEEFLHRTPPVENLERYEVVKLDTKDSVALIMCSSGTTGLPKGVMLTHLNLLTSLANHQDPRFTLFKQTKENTNLGMLPFFHALGFVTVFTSIIWGSPIVVMKHFDDKLFLKTIQDFKIVSMMLVPPIMVFLAKSPLVDNYDVSSLQHISCGAAPLSRELEAAVKTRLRVNEIRQGYGLTEGTLALMVNPPKAVKIGSSGMVVPYMKCKVVDMKTGEALGANQRGELRFKGPMVMKGYCGNPEATRETFDEDGWLRTGDVAYYDEDRYFYIVDRIKELIKYKAFQVAPAELEYLLMTNPNIQDAAVIGIPDEAVGELPMAFVVKQPGKNISAAEVQQFIAKQVSPQKRLHGGVVFVEAIPKNPSGKILRRVLRDTMKENKLNSKL